MNISARIIQNKTTKVCPALVENSSNISGLVSFLSFVKYILRRSTSNKRCFTISDVTETRISIHLMSFPNSFAQPKIHRGQNQSEGSLLLFRFHLFRFLDHFCYAYTHIIVVFNVQYLTHQQGNSNLATRVNPSHKPLLNQPQNPHHQTIKQRCKPTNKTITQNYPKPHQATTSNSQLP
jgi:hypothetical protein